MTSRPRVLLVCPPGGVAKTLATLLAETGCDVLLASDFASAKTALARRPSLLVTDLKLGAYNGLHLAIRAAMVGTAALVIGHVDPVLQADAERQQAVYLTVPLDRERALQEVRRLLDAALHTRRSERRQVPGLDVFADRFPARLLDVSYDGMRLEAVAPKLAELPPYFLVRLPQFNFACRVQRIWTAPAAGDESSAIWCGAAVAAADMATTSTWRTLVDAMPGFAAMF